MRKYFTFCHKYYTVGYFFSDDLTSAVLNTHINQPFISASFLTLMEGQNPLVLRDSRYRGVAGWAWLCAGICPAGHPWLTGTGMVCSGCRGAAGVRQGCWNDLGTGVSLGADLAVSVEGHLGSTFPFGTQHQWQLQQFISKDEVMVQD